eukprot:CAMPEP_0182459798 /NCGR_PEP_ID=MMETSP1319-20130603/4845_1 /TAXON_ID=172717 /ORGANISM="Bolidomonas pacifica, Strain RCC208" /LENGTH=100 /DNA_ID=CAMNT_0024658785 /DNA_START=42 /DNA_END=340 /DNA_ORIENTATION=+
MSSQRLVIYGLSASPPTLAHLHIYNLLRTLFPPPTSTVLACPVYRHMYAGKRSTASEVAEGEAYEAKCDLCEVMGMDVTRVERDVFHAKKARAEAGGEGG